MALRGGGYDREGSILAGAREESPQAPKLQETFWVSAGLPQQDNGGPALLTLSRPP